MFSDFCESFLNKCVIEEVDIWKTTTSIIEFLVNHLVYIEGSNHRNRRLAKHDKPEINCVNCIRRKIVKLILVEIENELFIHVVIFWEKEPTQHGALRNNSLEWKRNGSVSFNLSNHTSLLTISYVPNDFFSIEISSITFSNRRSEMFLIWALNGLLNVNPLSVEYSETSDSMLVDCTALIGINLSKQSVNPNRLRCENFEVEAITTMLPSFFFRSEVRVVKTLPSNEPPLPLSMNLIISSIESRTINACGTL